MIQKNENKSVTNIQQNLQCYDMKEEKFNKTHS